VVRSGGSCDPWHRVDVCSRATPSGRQGTSYQEVLEKTLSSARRQGRIEQAIRRIRKPPLLITLAVSPEERKNSPSRTSEETASLRNLVDAEQENMEAGCEHYLYRGSSPLPDKTHRKSYRQGETIALPPALSYSIEVNSRPRR